MKVKDLIIKLQQYENQDMQLVYDMFGEADIKECALGMGITLTPIQITKVIENLERYSDATEGMSWDTIEYYIDKTIKQEYKK